MIKKISVVIVICFSLYDCYIIDPGPVIKATKGEIWPKPKQQSIEETFSEIDFDNFKFQVINKTCDILEQAVVRYMKLLSSQNEKVIKDSSIQNKNWRLNPLYQGVLNTVTLNLFNKCEHLPYHGMDESYVLVHRNNQATIVSSSIWGILKGLESFSQMVHLTDDRKGLIIKTTEINDEPRFSYRGLLLDTSRHYMSVNTILQILNGMEYNKFNVFHWHIVDDHSFPYESKTFPELSKTAAYHPTQVYTQNDVARIIEYARVRGIRVVSEFDTPGHTRSWGVSHPEILTECEGQYKGKLGPINPIKQESYDFLYELFEEIVEVFPEKYVHLGGDEVGFECWQSNSNITKYMNENNITSYNKLEEEYIQKIVNKVTNLNASSIVWQEVYQNGVILPPETVIHLWTGNQQQLLAEVTRNGFKTILSNCWYLDHLSSGGDWNKYYKCDPHDFYGTTAQKKLVMGGEACMWSEVVDDVNVIQRIFPRASATAEKLWSQYEVNDLDNAKRRLEEHYCRMRNRGIAAQPPSDPGFCI